MDPVGRRLERFSPVRPWAVLSTSGGLLAVVAVWHYFEEVSGIGVGVGPVVAAAMGVSLSAGVVYAGVRLRASDVATAGGWLVVRVEESDLGGAAFVVEAPLILSDTSEATVGGSFDRERAVRWRVPDERVHVLVSDSMSGEPNGGTTPFDS
ncbi:MAG: hypothetical protein V5A44_04010 [Haloarculaceae archaeon]